MKNARLIKSLKAAATGLFGLLAVSAYGQIGSGWSSIAETFKIQTSGSGSVNGDTFKLTSTSSGVKDRAEREYNTWTSGMHQFQGDVTVVSLGGDRICLKQTFQKDSGPWNMVGVQKSGQLYEIEGGNMLASYTVGTTVRINTILDADHGTVQVYINGSLKETKTGGKTPIYDKCGTYRTDSGSAPVTATWTNVQFWQGGSSSGGGGTVSDPSFSPAGGTYTSAQTVSITSSTSGASIRYTTDGSTPSETAGTIYSSPVSVSSSETLTAIAYKSGSSDSNVVSATYTINIPQQVATPTFSPGAGSYTSAQSVTISTATSGASIRYTTDGSTPSETAGTLYSNTPVNVSSSQTLKAIAYKSGSIDSTVSSAAYTISVGGVVTLEAESLSPVGTGATVSISNDANASGGVVEFLNSTAAGQTITFTTPAIAAGAYQVQLRYKTNTSRGQHTVKIDGVQVGGTIDQYATTSVYTTATLGNATLSGSGAHTIVMTVTGKNSAASQFYLTADTFTFTPVTVQPQVSAPVFSPPSGTLPLTITITSATSGASIRYTTDGSTPSSTAGTVYSGPITITSTTTFKAIAYEAGFVDSVITTASYAGSPPPTLNFEAESLSPVGTGATVSTSSDANASGGVVEFLNSTAAGQVMTFTTTSIPAGTYQLQLRYWANTTRGQHTVKIDGTQIGGTIDQYATAKSYVTVTLGNVTFASAGTHSIAMTVTGKNSSATQFYLTADKFTFIGQ